MDVEVEVAVLWARGSLFAVRTSGPSAGPTALFQVEWFGGTLGPQCIQDNVGGGATFTVGTNPTLPLFPLFFPGGWTGADIGGRANVHASRRKMVVSAKLVCRDGATLPTSNLVAMTDLPVIDVR